MSEPKPEIQREGSTDRQLDVTRSSRRRAIPGLAGNCASGRASLARRRHSSSTGGAPTAVTVGIAVIWGIARDPLDRLLREIREARAQLPAEHRNLLAQIGTHEGVVEDWPTGVQDLFRSVQEVPPSDAALVNAAAVWLEGLRTVVFNGPLMQAATAVLTDASRKQLVAYIAWHEYGHALSLTRSTHEQRKSGVRLFGLLSDGYGVPEFLHPEIVQAFKEVIPWPPSQ